MNREKGTHLPNLEPEFSYVTIEEPEVEYDTEGDLAWLTLGAAGVAGTAVVGVAGAYYAAGTVSALASSEAIGGTVLTDSSMVAAGTVLAESSTLEEEATIVDLLSQAISSFGSSSLNPAISGVQDLITAFGH